MLCFYREDEVRQMIMEEYTPEEFWEAVTERERYSPCLLYTSPSPRDATLSRMPSSA